MQVGTLNTRLVIRKLQNNSSDFQVMLLAGFTPALSHRTAVYVETLSPAHVLTQEEIARKVAALVTHAGAAEHRDTSSPGVTARLTRLWGAVSEVTRHVAAAPAQGYAQARGEEEALF